MAGRATRYGPIALAIVAIGAVTYIAAHRFTGQHGRHKQVEGVLAPTFSLVDIDGRPLELSALRGKVVLLDFWATWCAPCRDEVPHLIDLQRQYGSRGLQVIGLSMDDSADVVRTFYRAHRMNYPVALADAPLAERYGGVLGLPVEILIGRDGRIAARHDGVVELAKLRGEIEALVGTGEK